MIHPTPRPPEPQPESDPAAPGFLRPIQPQDLERAAVWGAFWLPAADLAHLPRLRLEWLDDERHRHAVAAIQVLRESRTIWEPPTNWAPLARVLHEVGGPGLAAYVRDEILLSESIGFATPAGADDPPLVPAAFAICALYLTALGMAGEVRDNG